MNKPVQDDYLLISRELLEAIRLANSYKHISLQGDPRQLPPVATKPTLGEAPTNG